MKHGMDSIVIILYCTAHASYDERVAFHCGTLNRTTSSHVLDQILQKPYHVPSMPSTSAGTPPTNSAIPTEQRWQCRNSDSQQPKSISTSSSSKSLH